MFKYIELALNTMVCKASVNLLLIKNWFAEWFHAYIR